MKLIKKLFGDPNEKVIKSMKGKIDDINSFDKKFSVMADDELSKMTDEFRKRLGVGTKEFEKLSKEEIKDKLDEILPEAFAVVREAGKRILGERHFEVQLIGGIVLHDGKVAEMKTGEGKTLVATLPLYLNALTGKSVHLVTVNDYLARVGAGWMAKIYSFLGLTTSVITGEKNYVYDASFLDDSQYDKRLKHLREVTKKEAYECDVIYGTNNEFGFDYLRDNMAQTKEGQIQRGLNYAIIDEVDSILIDEARTPLIISAPAEESTDRYYQFASLVKKLKENEDYNIDEKMKVVTLSEEGINKMEKWLGVDNIYVEKGVREVHHIEQALKAEVLFKREKDYVVKDGEVIIVDEFTGRLMSGRRYSEGLHQAIEAKENVKIKRESQTLATITFQNFFRMYDKISGMTGTAITEAEEFSKIYDLDTVVIPTNKPKQRQDFNDLIYRTEIGKFKALIKDVKNRVEKGQPVLVGTVSISKNELLADMMQKEGLEPHVLNAKNHEKEAKIISDAGNKGVVTIATNMAGRGVDIILGGGDKELKKEIIKLGGLHVIGTERHESRRIDNQLRGRAGRQGDVGSSQFYISTEDDLMRIFGGERMQRLMKTMRVPEDMPIENKIISKSIESAQKKVEGNNFDIRKHLVEYDDVINKHRETIYKKRNEILDIFYLGDKSKKSLSDIILEMIEREIEYVVGFHTIDEKIENWNIAEIYQTMSTIFPVKEVLEEDLSKITSGNDKLDKATARTKIIEHLVKLAKESYDDLVKKAKEVNFNWNVVEKEILIRSIDTIWMEHIDVMSSMRQSIGLRGYGQRDPLVEYKKEAFRMFAELNGAIQKQVVYSIFKMSIGIGEPEKEKFKSPTIADKAQRSSLSQNKAGGNLHLNKGLKNVDGTKVGRNDKCPCGSGKKYKKCCGR